MCEQRKSSLFLRNAKGNYTAIPIKPLFSNNQQPVNAIIKLHCIVFTFRFIDICIKIYTYMRRHIIHQKLETSPNMYLLAISLYTVTKIHA